ncbi:MAG: methyltransferase domain-containing protein [Microgenomates group bacterium]|nr:methyltransferase domain-containing protein [Microgenomates group bacterium]
MKKKEKDIKDIFNDDVTKFRRYLYTGQLTFSDYAATKKQSDEIVNFIKKYVRKKKTILDIGCGDGTYTLELFERIKPKKITGFDIAEKAIKIAKKKVDLKLRKRIFFTQCDIYNIKKRFKKGEYDLGIMRGVIHHLDNPQKAIKLISQVIDQIIVLEPNGYSPIMKIIEKVSSYHRQHKEKSYWPPTLNYWFRENGYKVVKQKFCNLVPYFCPDPIARFLKKIEPMVEKIPFFSRFFVGTNLILYRKK